MILTILKRDLEAWWKSLVGIFPKKKAVHSTKYAVYPE